MSDKEPLASIQPPPDTSRRRLLITGAGVVGAVGAAIATWPFIASWKPSARARIIGAPVEVNVGGLEPGQLMRVTWRGQTIGILRRTERMLEDLKNLRDELRDPDSEAVDQQPQYTQNEYRSIRPEFLVLNVHCTHLGCVPQLIPEAGPQPFDENWKGGFFCPCHRSRFDLAGRVYRGVPAALNLLIPPYAFQDEENVIIGADPVGTV